MYEPSHALGPIAGEPPRRDDVGVHVDGRVTAACSDVPEVRKGARAYTADVVIERHAASVNGQDRRNCAHDRYLYRITSPVVKSSLTGMTTPMTEPMQLAEVLERIEARLKVLNMTENAASQAAGKPDAIRNLRRGLQSGARKGISTATLAALAPVLKTSADWLLTGRNAPEVEETAVEAAVSLPYADAILALTFAFEALRLGSDAECRVLARAVLAATRTRRSPQGGPFSDDERRQLVSEAIRLFRT